MQFIYRAQGNGKHLQFNKKTLNSNAVWYYMQKSEFNLEKVEEWLQL